MQNPNNINQDNVNDSAFDKQATTIQKHFRGFLARKKFNIPKLPEQKRKSYRTFIVGNDPMMPQELDNYHEPNDKIALIANSGLRAISLACKLGNPKNTPKIILIDSSNEVCEFWNKIKKFMADDSVAGTLLSFIRNFTQFLLTHSHLYRPLPSDAYLSGCTPDTKYLNQNPITYFRGLIQKYGYPFVRAVILNTSVIQQQWQNREVFQKVNNILTFHNINKTYVYASNIGHCLSNEMKRKAFLENIA